MRSLRFSLVLWLSCLSLLLPAMASHRHHHTVLAHPKRSARVSAHSRRRHPSNARPRSIRSRHLRRKGNVTAVSTRSRRRRASTPRKIAPKQAEIAPTRAVEIQNALVRAGYLQHGSGVWDSDTQAALRRYQQDHHWQTRNVPDARALIALGLGPRQNQSSLDPSLAGASSSQVALHPQAADGGNP